MCHELAKRDVRFERQLILPITYGGIQIDAGLRLDVVIEGRVIAELKSVEALIPLFDAQLLTYLKLSGLRLDFLINFNVPLLKDGIKRLVR